MIPRYAKALSSLSASACIFACATTAAAFEAKHTPDGTPVRWDAASTAFALSPTLDDIGPGARDGVAAALASWKGAAVVPALYTFPGKANDVPGYDGKNIVTYAKDGYAAAGSALAVTVLTYDDATGHIVDCDIVLNGKYAFAKLDRAARAESGVRAVSTESGGAVGAGATFDLVHVMAHEAGHALGLSDEPHETSALMYPFTLPNDASMRAPASDDLAGIAEIYATAALSSPAAAASSGCSMSAASSASAPLLFALGALAIPFVRRRRRAAVAMLGAFVTVAVALPARAHDKYVAPSAAHAHAYVTASKLVVRDGIFTTDIELTTDECHRAACPVKAMATVFGGRAGGLTQEISGHALPRIGQRVALAFEPHHEERAALVAE